MVLCYNVTNKFGFNHEINIFMIKSLLKIVCINDNDIECIEHEKFYYPDMKTIKNVKYYIKLKDIRNINSNISLIGFNFEKNIPL